MVIALLLLVVLAYGLLVEPRWLAVRRISLGGQPHLRVVHLSDLHYKGDRRYLQRVVQLANGERPAVVCITGDFVSQARQLPEALDLLGALDAPVYAVPGNWDYWSKADLAQVARFCERSGGKLLLDESLALTQYGVTIYGARGQGMEWLRDQAAGKRLLLMHYPLSVERLDGHSFDLLLAGHAHGGQVRLPWIGAPIVPFGVGRYKLGLYDTPAGPLYVTSGIGTSALPLRLGCRPEIAVIDF